MARQEETNVTQALTVESGSLVVIGTGIMLAGQITVAAKNEIIAADRLIAKTNNALSARWLQGLNPKLELLDDLYDPAVPRNRTYQCMVARIMDAVRRGERVCAVFYGHPGVFVDPAHAAIRQARAEGYRARMLPGISAEDCLVADLGIDPGRFGMQCFEATSFLFHEYRHDPTCALVLWQIDVVGDHTLMARQPAAGAIDALVNRLCRHYARDQEIVLYEAATLPIEKPRIDHTTLDSLGSAQLNPATTLYIPPCGRPKINQQVMRALGLSESQLLGSG